MSTVPVRRNMLSDLLPDTLAEDDFHEYVVKWVNLGTFPAYQFQALCAFDNESAWKALEAQNTIARNCLKWKDTQEEALRQGRRQESFAPELLASLQGFPLLLDMPSVQAFIHESSPRADASKPQRWRNHLVCALLDPILSMMIECRRLEMRILEADIALFREMNLE